MNDTAITVSEPTAIARPEDVGLSIETLVARVDKIKQVQARVMKEGHHFGNIPGIDRPTLLQPGAQMLCMTFQLAPTFDLDERRDGDHLEVVARCTLTHSPTGAVVGGGVGSCSTRESRYAFRKGERACPECGAAALLKSKHEPEWFCWSKKGGCGAKFDLNDRRISSQEVGRVDNPDLADTWNTIRKMAVKRALVAATLIATAASDIFGQDIEPDPAAAAQPKGPKPSNDDLFSRIAESIAKAETVAHLTAIARQLQDVKDHRSLPPEPFKRLRAAWAKKRDDIEHDQRPYSDAEYEDADIEDVERGAIAGEGA